jgi:hypothetical protein
VHHRQGGVNVACVKGDVDCAQQCGGCIVWHYEGSWLVFVLAPFSPPSRGLYFLPQRFYASGNGTFD